MALPNINDLLALFPDNTTGNISAADQRDYVQQIHDYLAMVDAELPLKIDEDGGVIIGELKISPTGTIEMDDTTINVLDSLKNVGLISSANAQMLVSGRTNLVLRGVGIRGLPFDNDFHDHLTIGIGEDGHLIPRNLQGVLDAPEIIERDETIQIISITDNTAHDVFEITASQDINNCTLEFSLLATLNQPALGNLNYRVRKNGVLQNTYAYQGINGEVTVHGHIPPNQLDPVVAGDVFTVNVDVSGGAPVNLNIDGGFIKLIGVGEIPIYANESDLNALDARVTVNEGDIATNIGNIDTNSLDIASNASNIATNTSDIATNAADIITAQSTADQAILDAAAAQSTADGKVASVSSGTNINVDNTDSLNPVVNLLASIVGMTVNGVVLNSAGAATDFLAADGNYYPSPLDGVQTVSSGTNINVDNADPVNPIVNLPASITGMSVNGVSLSTGAGAALFLAGDGTYKPVVSGVLTVSSGTNITVDNTDPANPIINLPASLTSMNTVAYNGVSVQATVGEIQQGTSPIYAALTIDHLNGNKYIEGCATSIDISAGLFSIDAAETAPVQRINGIAEKTTGAFPAPFKAVEVFYYDPTLGEYSYQVAFDNNSVSPILCDYDGADLNVALTTTGAGTATLNNKTIATNALDIITIAGTTHTVTDSDNGKILHFTNAGAVTLTINTGLDTGGGNSAGFNFLVETGNALTDITLAGTATRVNFDGDTKIAVGDGAIATFFSSVNDRFNFSGNTA